MHALCAGLATSRLRSLVKNAADALPPFALAPAKMVTMTVLLLMSLVATALGDQPAVETKKGWVSCKRAWPGF